MFNEDFRHGDPFKVDSKDFPFVNLNELIQENGHKVLKVQKVFVLVPKKGRSKGKELPVLVAEGHCIYLPVHCLAAVKKILSDQKYIDAINEGKCGFETYEYEDTQYGNGTCFSGNFIDI